VEDALGAQWVLDADFDIARHVVAEVPLPLRGQSREQVLRERVGELCSQPLDPAHPLWQFQLIEDMGDGTSALIARIHHCIADGIALIAVMLSITDGGRRRRSAGQAEPRTDWLLDAFLRPLTNMTVKAIGMTGRAWPRGGPGPARRPWWPAGDGPHGLPGGVRRGRVRADARRLAHAAQGQARRTQAWPGTTAWRWTR
jgi:hypothetical protein